MTNKLTNETAQKIDFLIQGVESGKFDEVVKKIEFMKNLSGDHDLPTYIQDVISDIRTLENDYMNVQSRIEQLEAAMSDFEQLKKETQQDMLEIAKALQYLFKPDPLDSRWDLDAVEAFIARKGARKY